MTISTKMPNAIDNTAESTNVVLKNGSPSSTLGKKNEKIKSIIPTRRYITALIWRTIIVLFSFWFITQH